MALDLDLDTLPLIFFTTLTSRVTRDPGESDKMFYGSVLYN